MEAGNNHKREQIHPRGGLSDGFAMEAGLGQAKGKHAATNGKVGDGKVRSGLTPAPDEDHMKRPTRD